MWELLETIENTDFAESIRSSSLPVYSTILAFHTVGLAFLVGLSVMIALRVLGFAPALSLAPMRKFFPLIVIGFWVNVITGIVLTMLAAVHFFSTPAFYIKLAAIAAAVVSFRAMMRTVFDRPAAEIEGPLPARAKTWAHVMLVFWTISITTGRLIAYDSFLEIRSAAAVLVFIVIVLVVRYVGARFMGSSEESVAGKNF